MIKINLLAEGKKPVVARKASASSAALKMGGENAALWLATVLGLLAILVVAGYWFYLGRVLATKEKQIQVAQKEVDELKPILKEVEEYKAKKEELEHKIAVINELKANQRGPVQIMDNISRALPELLWLDRLDMKSGSVTLKGRAFNTNAVANFIENLGKVPEFQEPVLKDTAKRGEVYNFEIAFKFAVAQPTTAAGTTPAPPANKS